MTWDENLQKATFSAGKFWGVQFYFDQIPGVISSRVGYIGGNVEHPIAEQVARQNIGHTEAIEISYDPSLVNYDTLLKHFFRIHDPTQVGGQGEDVGNQFRSEIYYHSDDKKILEEITINQMRNHYKKLVTTKLLPATIFYEAAPADQKYTQKTGDGARYVPYEAIQEN